MIKGGSIACFKTKEKIWAPRRRRRRFSFRARLFASLPDRPSRLRRGSAGNALQRTLQSNLARGRGNLFGQVAFLRKRETMANFVSLQSFLFSIHKWLWVPPNRGSFLANQLSWGPPRRGECRGPYAGRGRGRYFSPDRGNLFLAKQERMPYYMSNPPATATSSCFESCFGINWKLAGFMFVFGRE
jgi:hypothetical protein